MKLRQTVKAAVAAHLPYHLDFSTEHDAVPPKRTHAYSLRPHRGMLLFKTLEGKTCLVLSGDCSRSIYTVLWRFVFSDLLCQRFLSCSQLQNCLPMTLAPPVPWKGHGWPLLPDPGLISQQRWAWLHTSGGYVLLETLPGIFKIVFWFVFSEDPTVSCPADLPK